MKKILVVFIFCITISPSNMYGQIFSQNFNSSTTLTDYYNSSPGTNQFRLISTTNSNSSVSVATNSLVIARLNASTTNAYAERNVDFSSIPSAVKFQFSFSVNGTTTATQSVLGIYIGGDVSNASTTPTLTNIYARFTINTTSNNGEFVVRDQTNSANGSHTFTGTQTITWVINNTTSAQTYLAPNGSSESISIDKADIWVGSTKEFNNVNVETTTQTLARFKFLTVNWTSGTTFTIDDIVIENETSLPVELTSFTSTVKDNKIQLNWQTATEVNNYGFSVERRAMSEGTWHSLSASWETLGFVHGSGNSNSIKNYSYTDQPTGGKEFRYRLKQIDLDGNYEYSSVIIAVLENVNQLVLDQNYPNPFNPSTTISYSLPERANVRLRVYDMLAKEIAELINEDQCAGRYEVAFDGSNLSSGTYFYRLEANNKVEVKKFVLIK